MNPTGLHLAQHFGKHYRAAFAGGNWSDNSLRQHLEGLPLAEATRRHGAANSIAAIAYHLHYFVNGVLNVLTGQPLDTRDAPSWETPAFATQAEWDAFVARLLADGEAVAAAFEALPEEGMWLPFHDPKYSSVFTNGLGILEHTYYHLGQVAVLRRVGGA